MPEIYDDSGNCIGWEDEPSYLDTLTLKNGEEVPIWVDPNRFKRWLNVSAKPTPFYQAFCRPRPADTNASRLSRELEDRVEE